MVKLWSVDDISLADDIAEMTRKLGEVSGKEVDREESAERDLSRSKESVATLVQEVGGHQVGGQQVVEQEDHQVPHGVVEGSHGNDGQVSEKLKQVGCRTCCCSSHHQYDLHYSGMKFIKTPSLTSEGLGQSISLEYTNTEVVVNKKRGLEDIMMAVGVDLTDFVSL